MANPCVCGELGPDLTRKMLLTHAKHSRRFSAQTRSQRKQIVHRIQARAGSAGCSRQKQEVTIHLRCRDHMIFLTKTQLSALITTNSVDIFVFYVCDATFSSLRLSPVRSIIYPPTRSLKSSTRESAEHLRSSVHVKSSISDIDIIVISSRRHLRTLRLIRWKLKGF